MKKQETTIGTVEPKIRLTTPQSYPEHRYNDFEALIASRIAMIEGPIFQTSADPDTLWAAYLNNFPAEVRQHYNCHHCRHFIQRYGGLAQVDAEGDTLPVLWGLASGAPEIFQKSVTDLRKLVTSAKVEGVFLWGKEGLVWGMPRTGEWSHLHGKPSAPHYTNALYNAEQVMAAKREDYGVLQRSLAEYDQNTVEEAARVLNHEGALARSEKVIGVANWFLNLHKKIEGVKNKRRRDNIVWLAVATAPPGWCHVKNQVFATLMDDIKSGATFEQANRRWKEKMDPLQYQRPQAPPKEGNIQEAERIVDKLGVRSALERRPARLEDILSFLWQPPEEVMVESIPPKGGAFDHLRPRNREPLRGLILPAVSITWDKFYRTIIEAGVVNEMWVTVPDHGPFYGLMTAADPDAAPILQWDGLEFETVDGYTKDKYPGLPQAFRMPRNPVSWYFYRRGSSASTWSLQAGTEVKVSAVFNSPAHWMQPEKFSHHAPVVMLALEGARDTNNEELGLFPEILRSELREIRSVIEAHSKSGQGLKLEESDNLAIKYGNAHGIAIQKDNVFPINLRVKTQQGKSASYKIDRWD